MPLITEPTTTRPTSTQTSVPSASPACTRWMTWPTTSGCASVAAAARMLRNATRTSTPFCSKTNGRSCRRLARGPSPFPKRGRRVRVVLDM